MIGEAIRRARFASGLSLSALAEAAGIHKSTLSRWENGKSVPYTEELERVLAVLELPEQVQSACWKAMGVPRGARQLRTQEQSVTNGELLRALRIRARVSQTEAARMVGVSQAALSEWENDDAWPGAENLRELCRALNATPGEVEGLLARSWRPPDCLPQDKEALDAYLVSLVRKDTLLERSLLYLAVSARYTELFRRGIITETEALEVWGFYGNHLYMVAAEHLGAPDIALENVATRIARPCFNRIAKTRGALTWGQARAFATVSNIEVDSTHKEVPAWRRRKREMLEELLPRVPRHLQSYWLDSLAMVCWHLQDDSQFDLYSQKSIEASETDTDARVNRQRYARLLCWRGRYADALVQLQKSEAGAVESRVYVVAERELATGFALAGTDDRRGACVHLERALDLLRENPAFYQRATVADMAQQLATRIAA